MFVLHFTVKGGTFSRSACKSSEGEAVGADQVTGGVEEPERGGCEDVSGVEGITDQ